MVAPTQTSNCDSARVVNGHVGGGTETTYGYQPVNGHGPITARGQGVNAASMPIAICGMACRLPKGIRSPAQLWDFLLAGGDARGMVPESRYNIDAFYDPSGKPGTSKTQHGYFLEEDLTTMDTSFYSMPRKEVERMDPQQRLLLEVARECFEDGGETDWRGKKIGCYVGNLGDDWLEMLVQDTQNYGVYRYSGYGDFSLSNRISFEMDLQGPSVTVRTACSASMVALHEACAAIERGDCISAIVGGTNLILRPGSTAMMSEQGILSPDGSCKTFSTAANGYGRGEAIVGVFVKPLDHAIRDGNAIRAVIRATATNHDGKTAGFTMPNPDAQEAVIRRAYQLAGLDTADTGYFECHGTGTPVGDPIETSAVASIFQNVGITIGSTKPNFGHTEGASGILSVLKSVLMLENKRIPPSIKYSPKSPKIPWQSGKLSIAEEPLPWPTDRLERISVNSFGLGGSNAHVIIESASNHRSVGVQTKEETPPQLLLYSANTQQSLSTLIDNYKTFVQKTPLDVDKIAYTLARGREHLKYRAFAIAHGSSVAPASPVTKPGQQRPKIAMVFTGQGAQWPQMGAELLKSNSVFRSTIRFLDKYIACTLGDEAPSWTIEKELLKPGKRSRLSLAEFAQPLCTAIQIALIDTLRSIGVEADAVVGHSSGEIAGAYAAGALTAGEAITTALYRGLVTNLQEKPGAMAAIGMSVAGAEQFLMSGTCIACDNSPRSVTISGDADRIEEVVSGIRAARPDILVKKLQVDKAYHSHHMVEIGDIYNALLEQRLVEKIPQKPFFSSVESRLLDDTLGSRYWQKNLESPVLFNGAVTELLRHFSGQEMIFLEIGPHSVLAGPLTQIMAETPNNAKYLPTLIRHQNAAENFLSTVGKLFTFDVPVDYKILFPSGSCLSDLPRYPFTHGDDSYWFESRLSKDFRHRKHPHHDLLGVRILESTDIEPSWRNVLHISHNTTWLKNHKVGGDIVFPFAGYAAMAGEAVRQTTRIEDAFRLRHISISSAMLLSEERPTEIVTTLRPLRLTISQLSSWYEFTIAAYNGSQWTSHCTGQVKADAGALSDGTIPEPFPRSVEWERWFEGVRRGGLDLGYDFHNLDGITASTTTYEAQGIVSSKKHPRNPLSPYHMHPAVLDSVLQLNSVASANGLTRKHRNFLPVFCDQLYVARNVENFVANAKVTSMNRETTSSRIVECKGIVNGKVILKFEGLELSSANITGDSVKNDDPHAASRLTWDVDIDLVDQTTLFKISPTRQQYAQDLDDLGKLSIISIHKQLANIDAQDFGLERYAQWIRSQAASFEPSSYDDEMLTRLQQRLAATPAAAAADALVAITSSIESIYSGNVLSWEGLVSSKTLASFYDFMSEFGSSPFFGALGHSNPNLRVLEISNWSRTPSSTALQSLSSNGRHLWSQYTFASEVLVAPEERSLRYPDVEYVALDISEDTAGQGLRDRQYDIIIINNALHATPNLLKSLRNVKKLLAPAGRLLLQELNPASKWINVIFGTDPTWWCGVADGRAEEPYIDAARWLQELERAGGFTVDAVVNDSEETSRINSVIIARPSDPTRGRISKPISLLVRDKDKTYEVAEKILRDQGFEITKITLKDRPQPGVEIISIIDLDGPFLENITDEAYYDFQKFLANLQNSGIFWITKPCHVRVQDPRYAQIIGLARVIRSELLIDLATCEIDDVESSFFLAGQAFEKFCTRESEGTLGPEFEYVVDGGLIKIGRYFPFTLQDGFIQEGESERMKVVIGTPGRLNTLHWVRQPEPAPLGDHDLEIEMHAVGVNFKDVLVGMNLVNHVGRYNGLEGAGVVRRVGAGVQDFRPGDRVVAMEHNMLSTVVIAHEIMCAKIPDTLSFIDAATMFTVYATVQQSLITIGRLRKSDSLLIHSACGGVGLAAIQVAQMIGAEIYATVGSEVKAQYLIKTFGIPRDRIFNSRDNSFVEGVYRESNGRGVDLVLNSLSGELLHETWKCVAPHGKLIEIGKRELIGHGKLDMEPFVANRSYCCVDIDAFYDVTMSRFKDMMNETLEYLDKGLIKPIAIAKEFDASSVAEAFQYLLPGTHIGRVGVRIRDSEAKVALTKDEVSNPPRKLELDPEASYLLVGGLGGLGRAIATYMVEHGARSLVYLGRSAGRSNSDQAFVHELQSMGVDVTTVRGDVTDLDDVSRAVAAARAPLKGVLQLSTVQADENFSRLTKHQWDVSVGPKVTGTWNLHHATEGLDLDFFLVASSMAAAVGFPGQANYASGNAFLDAFVQHRHRLGLACSAIDIGPVADMGLLADRAALQRTAVLAGNTTVREPELLDAVALAIMSGVPSPATPTLIQPLSPFADPHVFVLGLASSGLPLDSPANRTVWKKDRRMAIYHNESRSSPSLTSSPDGSPGSTSSSSSTSALKAYLANARTDPQILSTPAARSYFASEIGKRLFGLLLKDESELDVAVPLADLGLDSLVAIELRAWWKQTFGFDVSVLEMLGAENLETLGRLLCERLGKIVAGEGKKE